MSGCTTTTPPAHTNHSTWPHPAEAFHVAAPAHPPSTSTAPPVDRCGAGWVSRRVCSTGIVCVSWQQVSIGRHHAGQRCDVHVDGEAAALLDLGDDLVKTAARTSTGEVRNKRAARTSAQA